MTDISNRNSSEHGKLPPELGERTSLFRPEALEHRQHQWLGEVGDVGRRVRCFVQLEMSLVGSGEKVCVFRVFRNGFEPKGQGTARTAPIATVKNNT